MEIKNTSALVTGGGSGLGEATARLLAKLGAKVAIVDRDVEKAVGVALDIGGIAFKADVTSEDEINDALDKITDAHGTPRICAHCAGIGGASRIIGREGVMPLEEFQRTINVNLVGTFNVLRLVAGRMSKIELIDDDERGVIINTASVAAFDGQIGQAAYASSKGGIVAMSLPAAREFSRFGIRVNVVAPGIFLTPLLDELPLEAQKALAADIPFPQRLGDPNEFADAVRFCVENKYINAEVIRLDGGVRLKAK